MTDESVTVGDLDQDETVFIRPHAGSGKRRAVHTDRDCRHLSQTSTYREIAASKLHADMAVCSECAGTADPGPSPGENPMETRDALLEMDPDDLVADGGTRWSDLTGFQRDILEVIQRLESESIDVYGLAIKETLSEDYGEVNHGRLYPNLDVLVERGLVEKSELDRRTNEYVQSDAGEQLLRARTRRLMQTTGVRTPAADGGKDV